MLNNILTSTPKRQNHLLKQIRDQLDRAKRSLPKKESPQKNSFELNQSIKKHKKTLNKSVGNNNVNRDLGISNQDSFSLLPENIKINNKISKNFNSNSFKIENPTDYVLNYNNYNHNVKESDSFSNNNNNNNFSKEISTELMKALSILRNSLPEQYNEEFFKTIMRDIANLLEILNEITAEATNFSESLKIQNLQIETENKNLKSEISILRNKIEEIQNGYSNKNDEIEKLKIKEANFSKTQFVFEDKPNLYSANSFGLSHSTKNSDDHNKMRKMLTDLKNENETLKDEINTLRIENKKVCDLVAHQKSQKIIKNMETKVDTIKILNETKPNRNSKLKANSNELLENDEPKLEKMKKFRFLKPKN